MKNISVLIPYRTDNGPRDIIFTWVKEFYRKLLPEAEICLGSCNTPLFSRSQAINDAAQRATRDIYVIADADIVYNPDLINEAIKSLDMHAWVVPYSEIQYIREKSTSELLNTKPVWPIELQLEMDSLSATAGWDIKGGLIFIPRKFFEAVKGFDDRFMGWGGEDDAFALSVNTLYGPFERLTGSIYHLWHPPVKAAGNPNYAANFYLYSLYEKACDNPSLMQQLISQRN